MTVPKVALTASPASGALETELLFGESVKVLERTDGYGRVVLETDGYEGWVKADMTLAASPQPTHRLCCAAIYVLASPDVKSPSLMRLSMGARLVVSATHDGWHRVELPDGSIGWIPEMAARPVDNTEDDFVSVAERFLGLPYLWGGRSAAGLDCSALVQLSLQAVESHVPEIPATSMIGRSRAAECVIDRRDTRRGDLVFWPAMSACAAQRQLSFMPTRIITRWRRRRRRMPCFAQTPPRRPKASSFGSPSRPSGETAGREAPTAAPVTGSPSWP